MELDIPGLMAAYNRIVSGNADEGDVFVCSRYKQSENNAAAEDSGNDALPKAGQSRRRLSDVLPPDKLPSACVGCGQCMFTCREGIGIPAIIHELVLLDI